MARVSGRTRDEHARQSSAPPTPTTQKTPGRDLGFLLLRAGDGNRTRVASLEDWGSTIELRPRAPQVAGPRHAVHRSGSRRSAAHRRVTGTARRPPRPSGRGIHPPVPRPAAPGQLAVARPAAMYPTCRTDGVWRSLVARPLWERKVVGSNPATPTSSTSGSAPAAFRRHPLMDPSPAPGGDGRVPPRAAAGERQCEVALWASSSLRLLCKLRARVSLYRARSAGA